jgi:hypothetical protein
MSICKSCLQFALKVETDHHFFVRRLSIHLGLYTFMSNLHNHFFCFYFFAQLIGLHNFYKLAVFGPIGNKYRWWYTALIRRPTADQLGWFYLTLRVESLCLVICPVDALDTPSWHLPGIGITCLILDLIVNYHVGPFIKKEFSLVWIFIITFCYSDTIMFF